MCVFFSFFVKASRALYRCSFPGCLFAGVDRVGYVTHCGDVHGMVVCREIGCLKLLANVYAERDHYQTMHVGVHIGCQLCDRTFKHRSGLSKHMRRVHVVEAAVEENPGKISAAVVEDQSVDVVAVPGSSELVDGKLCLFVS